MWEELAGGNEIASSDQSRATTEQGPLRNAALDRKPDEGLFQPELMDAERELVVFGQTVS